MPRRPELREDAVAPVDETSFSLEGLRERNDLQRVLRENVDVVSPDTLVIAEEYGDWSEGRRRIDLLGLDSNANLVVIELKRNETGAHMELQAIRYAAMVSTMTFSRAVQAFQDYLERVGREDDAEARILEFLGWEEPQEDDFAQEVRIVLASAEFSRELTTAVIWLNERGLDIRCVRIKPYKLDEHVLLDVQQVIPLPEAAEYQVRVREKAEEKRQARASNADFTRYDLTVAGETHTGLWKRRMLYAIVRAAIDAGADPEEIERVLPGNRRRVLAVEGEVSADDFREALGRMTTKRGQKFDPRRYFLDDEELIRKNGRTYAISNQWGGKKFFRAVRALSERFPELGIEYRETGGG